MVAGDAVLDVLVVGGGPAGWAAAITIAGKGLCVALADRAHVAEPCGETLAPAGATVLRSLGVWDSFRAGPHSPCHVYRAVWGSAALTHHELLRSPGGPAWIINRSSLIAALRARALACGATWLQFTGAVTADQRAGRWRIRLGSDQTRLLARWIVDASGRAGVIARRMGAVHATEGRQIAFIGVLTTDAERRDASILVEATEDGWWYSAQLPTGQLVLAYFTDRDLVNVPATREGSGFMALLERTGATAKRVASASRTLDGRVRVVAAHDSAIDPVWGAGWVAVGDAAFAYDPLSGHGITAALASGRDGGRAIAAALTGNTAALPRHAEFLSHARKLYRDRRLAQYAAERRWAEYPFWARRTAYPARR